jgi:hypothetical protein
MGKSKSPSVEIPSYTKPEASAFDLWGTKGLYDKATNTYGITDPNELATLNATKKIRSDLLKSLGLGGDISQDAYTQALMKESLRLAQPTLENALIGRGLGGSTIYKDALTDLISKAGTQAILSGQQYKLNDLNALQNYITGQQSLGQNLLNMVSGQYNTDQQLALNQYLSTLPYYAQVNQGEDYSGLGSLLGMGALGGLSLLVPGTGIGIGGLTGAELTALGALAGGSIGSIF